MPAAVNEMKALLLDMLECAFQASDVTATQQMGVQMSNAVKREGVVIIQNQNVEVYARIIPSMVKALRLCDSFEPAVAISYDPASKQFDYEAVELSDPIEECCKYLYDQGFNWEAMQQLMRSRYIEYVLGKYKTKTEASKFLGVGATYLCKMTKDVAK